MIDSIAENIQKKSRSGQQIIPASASVPIPKTPKEEVNIE
jgi:hypothetical protein